MPGLLTVQDIITPTTAAEIEAIVLSLCASADPPLPTSSWQPGSVIRTMIAEISEMVSRYALVDTEIAKGGFGDLASPEWAKLWAQQIYDVLFVAAKPATGTVDAVNATATPYVLNAGDMIVAHSVTGMTYRNQAPVTITASTTTPNIAIQADVVGTGSNAAPTFVSKIIAPGTLIGVTVSNPAAVLGADEELTAALVARTRAKLGSFSPNGPKDAYDYVARTPLDSFPMVEGTLLTPTSTPITRSRTTGDFTTGNVISNLGTADGAPTPSDVVLVQLGFDRWAEPLAVRSVAVAAVTRTIDLAYDVFIKSSLTEAQISSMIQAALALYFSTLPVGGAVVPPDTGKVYVESLEFVAHLSVPGIVRVKISQLNGVGPPPLDISLAPNEVPILGSHAPVIHFI